MNKEYLEKLLPINIIILINCAGNSTNSSSSSSSAVDLENPHMFRNVYRPAKLGCHIKKCFFSTKTILFMGAHRPFRKAVSTNQQENNCLCSNNDPFRCLGPCTKRTYFRSNLAMGQHYR